MEKIRLTTKEVIMLIGWVLSMAALYYNLKSEIDSLNQRVGSRDLGVLEYKVDQLTQQIKESNDKADNILRAITKHK